MTGQDSRAIGSRDWNAIHDHMPGAGRTLTVSGTVDYPTPGYRAELRRAEPQGINPKILELNLVDWPPVAPQAQVVTPVDVRYEEATSFEYDQVHIRELGESIDVVHPR